MSVALSKLANEDPSFRVRVEEESGQTIISGMGKLHLDIIVDRMKREFSVEANIGKPQVAYREAFALARRQRASLLDRLAAGAIWARLVKDRAIAAPILNLSMRSLEASYLKSSLVPLRKVRKTS